MSGPYHAYSDSFSVISPEESFTPTGSNSSTGDLISTSYMRDDIFTIVVDQPQNSLWSAPPAFRFPVTVDDFQIVNDSSDDEEINIRESLWDDNDRNMYLERRGGRYVIPRIDRSESRLRQYFRSRNVRRYFTR